MYEELVKTLRLRAALWEKMYDEDIVLKQAADAIHTLSHHADDWEKIADGWRKRCKEAEEKIPRWIPVTERLPDKYVSVWTYSKFWMLQDEYIGEYDGENYFARQTTHVTHWQPLPEPPKDE